MGFVFGMWLQGGENVERVGEDEDEDELGLPGGRERKGGGDEEVCDEKISFLVSSKRI